MESKVAEFLKKKTYKITLVTNPDYLYINKLILNKLPNLDNSVITCDHLNFKGFTNGFYIGYTNNIVKILNRVNYYDKLMVTNTTKINYEKILKRSFEINNIKRDITDLFFIKIRANKNIQKFGIDFLMGKESRKNTYLEYLNKNKDKNNFYEYLLSKF